MAPSPPSLARVQVSSHGAAEFITPPPSVSVFPKVIVGATYAPPVTNDGLTRMALVVEHDHLLPLLDGLDVQPCFIFAAILLP